MSTYVITLSQERIKMPVHRFTQLFDGSILDTTTGEILGEGNNKGNFVFVPSRPKMRDDFFMFFQNAAEKLSEDKTITGETYRVFMKLLSIMDYENYILIPQAEIAEKLDMKRQQVHRAIKQLLDKEIIVRGEKLGKTYSYKLNISYGWKGKVINFHKAEEQHKKPKLVVDNTES